MSAGLPRVAAVVVSYNTADLTRKAVASVVESSGVDVEAWVVDNASSDGSAAAVRAAYPEAHVVAMDENVGFGRANNVALERTDAPWILLLNSDARLRDPCDLARLVALLEASPDVGVVGPRLESPAGSLEFSARAFPSVLRELARPTGLHRLLPAGTRARSLGQEFVDHGTATDTDWLTGACLLVRREVLREVGGFDPAIFLFAEELEWCWRVRRAGWRIRLEPSVTVEHLGGGSGDAPGAGKMRMAAAGEAYALRRHRGVAYLALFTAARVVSLAAEAVAQGILAITTRDEARTRRSRAAVGALGAWVEVLGRGGSMDPSGEHILGTGRTS